MVVGRMYKHPNCTDTCIEVLRTFFVKEDGSMKVKVRWWRVKYGKVDYCIGCEETIRKPAEYWKEWRPIQWC